MMRVGAPASMFSFSLWLILMMSTSLWVRSSSALMPDSRIMLGRTSTGGTGSTWRIIHSGRATPGSKSMSSRSSSGILSNHSLIMFGVSRLLTSSTTASSSTAISSCSTSRKLVGLVNFMLDWTIPQWGHSLNLLYFFACFTISFDVSSFTFPNSLFSSTRFFLYASASSSVRSILPQLLQVVESTL